MLKLLNRFAWAISLSIGFLITFSFTVLSGGLRYLGDDEILFFLVIVLFFGTISKKIFFSKKFINSRLEFFASGLKARFSQNMNVVSKKSKVETKVKEEIKVQKPIKNEIKYAEKKIEVVPPRTRTIKNKPSKIGIYLKNFFSENILAKVGSILVFLGVLFFMGLVWNKIPSVGKIAMGFVIGFSTFFAGIMLGDRGYKGESKILLGAGILINYLVILAGKHLIGDNYGSNTGIFGTGITFLFLILNTIFAILTSFIYKSRTLLIFSFIFAYLNPFLIGGSSTTPYVLAGYSMIVSLGALFIGYKNNDNFLTYTSFVLGNILFLLAPFESNTGWIVKMVCTALLGFLTLFSLYKDSDKSISTIFILNYIFIILQLFVGGENGILGNNLSFVTYMISILFFFGVGIGLFVTKSIKSISALLLFPVFIIIGLIFSGSLIFIEPALGIIVIAYLLGYSFLEPSLPNFFKYFFFIILGLFIFLINCFISVDYLATIGNDTLSFNLTSFLTVIFVSFVFLITSYLFSRKKGLEYLYSIGTIGGIMTLSPVLFNGMYKISDTFFLVSISSVILFGILNIILPFINENLIEKSKNLKNLITGSIFGVLFLGFQLYMYGDKFFPGVTLGFAYAGLAILYFVIGFLMTNRLGIENVKKDSTPKNTILSYLFISISIFSLAIAFVFSQHIEIISTVWLFEASILFYFFNKTKESKIFSIGIILFMIGIFKLFGLIDIVNKRDFIFLIPFIIIGLSLILNLENLNFVKKGLTRVSHDIFHILGVGTLGILLVKIIPTTGHGWSLLGISIFVFVIGALYSYYSSKILKIFFIVVFGSFMFFHLDSFSSIVWKINRDNVEYLISLQYIATAILGSTILFWNKFNKDIFLNNFVKGFYVLYFFFIVSNYILDIFNTTFAVTIFWGIVSSMLLLHGISTDKIKFRTSGLYLLGIVLGKIFIYDIWYGIDTAISRVVALIVIGILLIVISTRYSKKYGNNLKGEFNIANLNDPIKKSPTINKTKTSIPKKRTITKKPNLVNSKPKAKPKTKVKKDFVINKQIELVDIGNLKGVEFIFSDKTIKIRAINLLKIVKLIVDNFNGKTKFRKGELKQVYTYAKDNFKSDVSPDNYKKIIMILEEFVEKGGEVKFIEK